RRSATRQAQHIVADLLGGQAARLPEVVAVEIGDREGMLVAARPLELPTRQLVKGPPILEPRELVGAPRYLLPALGAHPEEEIVPARERSEERRVGKECRCRRSPHQ